MTDAQKLIAEVLRLQSPVPCYCGTCVAIWSETVAAEIDKALGGLTQETRTNTMSSAGMTTNYNTGEIMSYSDWRQDSRWVSKWVEVTE